MNVVNKGIDFPCSGNMSKEKNIVTSAAPAQSRVHGKANLLFLWLANKYQNHAKRRFGFI